MITPTARLAMVTLDCADAEASDAFWSGMLGWDLAHSERDYAMLTGPSNALGFGRPPAMIAGFLVTFGVRGLAIKFGWSLPVFRESTTRERWKSDRKDSA